jgi:hypothetical protein
MTVLIMPARRRRLPSHASDQRMSWSVTPGIRPAVTLACPAQWRQRPHCKNRAPAPTPDSAAQRHPLGDPTAWWATRSWVAPACMPLDGDDSTPGRGRLRPASGGVDYWPCSRPPRLSTKGTARGGGGGVATPGGEGGRGGGGRVGGGGGIVSGSPTRPHCGAAILVEGAWEFHRK